MSTQATDLEHSIVKTSNVLIRTMFFTACIMIGLTGFLFNPIWIMLITIFYGFAIIGVGIRSFAMIILYMMIKLWLMLASLAILFVLWTSDWSDLHKILPPENQANFMIGITVIMFCWYFSSSVTLILAGDFLVLLIRQDNVAYHESIQASTQTAVQDLELTQLTAIQPDSTPSGSEQSAPIYPQLAAPGFDLMYA